jgi:hypothetical protein
MNNKKYIITENIIKDIFQRLSIIYDPILLSFFKEVIQTTEGQINNLSLKQMVYTYQNVWNNTLMHLYAKYLPHYIIHQNEVGFEVTPFTVSLVSNSLEIFYENFSLSEDDIEYAKCTFASFKLDKRFIPVEDKNIINLTLGIMTFPPLMQLYKFYKYAYIQHAEASKVLLETVQNYDIDTLPFKTNIGLHFSNMFISQSTYDALGGIDGLIESDKLITVVDKLREIKNASSINSAFINANTICPHCGQKHDGIHVPQNAICYSHIISEYPELHKYIGFAYYDEYQNDIIELLLKIIDEIPKGINDIPTIKCIILVEGETEEIAIPAMAVIYGRPLAVKNIHVMNSGSKQKVLSDFRKLSKHFPKLKICIILDSDATREKIEIEKAIAGHRDRYSFKYITKGTFEDLIPKQIALDVLKTLYSINNSISQSDIDDKKGFIHQIEKLLWDKSKSKFDKIEFIKASVRIMQDNDVPDLIKELIDDAYNLAELK